MRVLFLLTAALIVYGSFYPWQFYDRELPANLFWILLHSWPPRVAGVFLRDAILNFFLYIPLGLTGSLALRGERPEWLRWLVPLLAGTGLSVAVELGQLYTPTRDTSTLDLLTNTAGTAAGLVLSSLVPRENRWSYRLRSHPEVLLLAALWTAWQIFPVLPALTRAALSRKLAVLGNHSFEASMALTACFGWLVMACAAQRTLPWPHSALALTLLSILVPARLVIYSRQVTSSEVAGTLIAVALWAAWFGRYRLRMQVAAAIGVLAILSRELLPFRWVASPARFRWMPFQASIESEPLAALPILFAKLFTYAAVIWTLSVSGLGLVRAAAVVTALLFVLELVQRHLLSRVPESTDPILALLAAGMFAALRHPAREKQ